MQIDQPIQAFIDRAPLTRISTDFLLKKGMAEVAAFTGDALLVKATASPLYALCADNDAAALHIMQPISDCTLLLSECTGADEGLMARYGFHRRTLYYNVYYPHAHPIPVETDVVLRPIPISQLDLVAQHYTVFSREDVQACILDESMLGGFRGDSMVGFIGVHEEGSVGMLHIFDAYRRQGLGFVLEALMINRVLAKGDVPYAQINVDNHASLALQKKLGMVRSEGLVSWMY